MTPFKIMAKSFVTSPFPYSDNERHIAEVSTRWGSCYDALLTSGKEATSPTPAGSVDGNNDHSWQAQAIKCNDNSNKCALTVSAACLLLLCLCCSCSFCYSSQGTHPLAAAALHSQLILMAFSQSLKQFAITLLRHCDVVMWAMRGSSWQTTGAVARSNQEQTSYSCLQACLFCGPSEQANGHKNQLKIAFSCFTDGHWKCISAMCVCAGVGVGKCVSGGRDRCNIHCLKAMYVQHAISAKIRIRIRAQIYFYLKVEKLKALRALKSMLWISHALNKPAKIVAISRENNNNNNSNNELRQRVCEVFLFAPLWPLCSFAATLGLPFSLCITFAPVRETCGKFYLPILWRAVPKDLPRRCTLQSYKQLGSRWGLWNALPKNY